MNATQMFGRRSYQAQWWKHDHWLTLYRSRNFAHISDMVQRLLVMRGGNSLDDFQPVRLNVVFDPGEPILKPEFKPERRKIA